jgi:hypothetical protein
MGAVEPLEHCNVADSAELAERTGGHDTTGVLLPGLLERATFPIVARRWDGVLLTHALAAGFTTVGEHSSGLGRALLDCSAGDEKVLAAVVAERLAVEPGPERLQLETGDVDGPSHSFLVAHQRELVPPPSRWMSIRSSPTTYRTVCGTRCCWWTPSRVRSRMSPSRSSRSTPASAARARACSSIAGDESMPRTGRPGRPGDRDCHATCPDSQLDYRPVRLSRQLDVERDVGRHVGGPVVVAAGEGLVPAHQLTSLSSSNRDEPS